MAIYLPNFDKVKEAKLIANMSRVSVTKLGYLNEECGCVLQMYTGVGLHIDVFILYDQNTDKKKTPLEMAQRCMVQFDLSIVMVFLGYYSLQVYSVPSSLWTEVYSDDGGPERHIDVLQDIKNKRFMISTRLHNEYSTIERVVKYKARGYRRHEDHVRRERCLNLGDDTCSIYVSRKVPRL